RHRRLPTEAHRGPDRGDLLGRLSAKRAADRNRSGLRRSRRGRAAGLGSCRLRAPGAARRRRRQASGHTRRAGGRRRVRSSRAALDARVGLGEAVTVLVQSVQPRAVHASGATIDRLTVDPAVVQLTVPVLPRATTRTVPVVPAVRGFVATGYWITRVTSDPSVVTVRGESGTLSAIDQVATAPIDVSGLGADKTFQVALLLPGEGTSLVKAAQATVTV